MTNAHCFRIDVPAAARPRRISVVRMSPDAVGVNIYNRSSAVFWRWRCIAPLVQSDVGRFLGRCRPMAEATAEERLNNRSPRLACLPGVRC